MTHSTIFLETTSEISRSIWQQLADDVLTVSDDEIIETLRFMLLRMKILVDTKWRLAPA